MTGAVIRCGDCKHFRRDKELWWVLLIPVFGQLLAPMIITGSYRFGRCVRPQLLPPADPGLNDSPGVSAAISREYECGRSARFFERRTPFFLRAMSFLARKKGSGAVSVTPDTATDADALRTAYEKLLYPRAAYPSEAWGGQVWIWLSPLTDEETAALRSCPNVKAVYQGVGSSSVWATASLRDLGAV